MKRRLENAAKLLLVSTVFGGAAGAVDMFVYPNVDVPGGLVFTFVGCGFLAGYFLCLWEE